MNLNSISYLRSEIHSLQIERLFLMVENKDCLQIVVDLLIQIIFLFLDKKI